MVLFTMFLLSSFLLTIQTPFQVFCSAVDILNLHILFTKLYFIGQQTFTTPVPLLGMLFHWPSASLFNWCLGILKDFFQVTFKNSLAWDQSSLNVFSSTLTSVSGVGMKTGGRRTRTRSLKSHSPRMYCTGIL